YMFYEAVAFNQDLSTWDISQNTDLGNMFDLSGLSTANYDALLIGWSSQIAQSAVYFGADGKTYSGGTAAAARAILTGTYDWDITDGGLNATYPTAGSFAA